MKVVLVRSSSVYEDSRASKEIFAFLEAGYEVCVLGWDRDGKALKECKAAFKKYINKISFHFFKEKTGGGTLEKVISRYKWGRWLLSTLYKIKDIDLIHACDYDTGLFVKKYCKKTGVPYVYDIFDYYVAAHPVPRFLKNVVEKSEISVINNARLTIICTEERKAQIKRAKPKRVLVIHNSPDISSVPNPELKYDYVYCGSLGRGRLIEEVVDEYAKHTDIKFVFAGNGLHKTKIRDAANEYQNFVYLGAINYDEVLKTEIESRVISAIYDPSIENHKLCAPNKFYEALALGKPLIVCKGTGIDKVVATNKIGIVIEYKVNEFYDALKYLLTHPEEAHEMGLRGQQMYSKSYRWEIMKGKLISEYNKILNGDN